MTIHTLTDPRGFVRYYIEEMGDWDDFPVIIEKVASSLGAVVVKRGDGPDARYCFLLIEGYEVIFTHNDMFGNCFYSRDPNAHDVLEKIAAMFS